MAGGDLTLQAMAAPAPRPSSRLASPMVPAGLFLGLGVLGLAAPEWLVSLGLVTLARALAVLGLLLLLRGGLVSFGQGLYFCLGGYAVGLLDNGFGVTDALLRLGGGALAALAVAVPLGFLLRRYRGIFFAMLSLAFSMLLYGVLVKSQSLGSSDGFNVSPSTFLGLAADGRRLQLALFLLACGLSLAACLAVSRYLSSILGALAPALKDNEVRIEYLGHSAQALVHVEYVAAAALAGLAGALTAMATGHVDPQMAYWTTSGEFVFVAILGGTGHALAAFLGAGVFEAIHTVALQLAPGAWRLIIGAALLALILALPHGLWSLIVRERKP